MIPKKMHIGVGYRMIIKLLFDRVHSRIYTIIIRIDKCIQQMQQDRRVVHFVYVYRIALL